MKRRIAFLCVLAFGGVLCLTPITVKAFQNVQLTGENGQWLCSIWVGPDEQFDIYAWIVPDTAGVLCAEYQLDILPENATLISSFRNPWISSETGNPTGAPGVTVCFHECKRDPIWMYKLTFVLIEGMCTIFEITAHDDTGELRAMTCSEPDHPYVQLYDFTVSGVLCPCPAVESSSWGAIKTLLTE